MTTLTTEAPALSGVLGAPVAAESLLDGLPWGVALLDADRRVVCLNSRGEALLGIDVATACGLPCHQVIRSERCFRACPLAPPGGADAEDAPVDVRCPVSQETDIIDRQRRKVAVRACVVSLRDLNGKAIGYMEVLEELQHGAIPDQEATELAVLEGFVSHSPVMQPLLSAMRIIAETDSNVLITGETGTGKDLLAEGIHKASARSGGPFVKVNCGALPEHLLESELFGHMRGAFTGAVSDKPGRFRLASGGTLFLTEVGDLPLPLQVKLLTVLDDQCIYPLGATRPVSVDVRIVAATHRDLEAMVRAGLFREDLLFRLNVVRLHVPPLREREGDTRLLLDHFMRRMAAATKRNVKGFTPDALRLLCEYPWPGNVRELRNVVEYAVHFATGELADVSSLPASIVAHRQPPASFPDSLGRPTDGALQPGHQEQAPGPEKSGAAERTGKEEPLFLSWQDKERHMILKALEQTGGRRQLAADRLGWSRSTLWRKLNIHGLV